MFTRTDFPQRVRVIENTWITLRDGTRLGARVWLPEGAEEKPVPAILEYLPYRKDDGLAQRDAMQYGYFAGHGYACLRVDLRGTGDSDGLLDDEYLALEQDDASLAAPLVPPPLWSPDGRQIMVENSAADGSSRVLLVDLASGVAAEIAEEVRPEGWMVGGS